MKVKPHPLQWENALRQLEYLFKKDRSAIPQLIIDEIINQARLESDKSRFRLNGSAWEIISRTTEITFGTDVSLKFRDSSSVERGVRLLRAISLLGARQSLDCDLPITILNVWSAVLPVRVAKEDLGDYVERINQGVSSGESSVLIALRVSGAIFWTGINAVGYLLKALGRTKSAG